jgi:cytochrome c5
MSANDPTTAHEEVHAGPIKTPKQLLAAVFFSFVVPIFAMIGLVVYVTSGNKPSAGTDDTEQAVAQRIQKIGRVAIGDASSPLPSAEPAAAATPPAAVAAVAPAAPAKVAAAGAGSGAGEALYKQVCVACHAAGVAGSPKFGDKTAWEPRIKTGLDMLTASAIKGKNAMPPRGGSAASDADIRSTVEYMVNAAK